MLTRRRRMVVGAVGTLLLGAIAYSSLLVLGADDPAKVATLIAALLPAVAMARSVLVGVASALRRPPPQTRDQLELVFEALTGAVAEFWSQEAAQRNLQLPAPINVLWTQTSREAFSSERRVPHQLTSGLVDRLIELYRSIPTPRKLVVIGDGGSGKSGALILLLLGVLKSRREEPDEHGSPLPVLLPLADWDPTEDPLRVWAARALEREYGFLRAPEYGPDAAARLLNGGRIALFLDGLDEMPNPTGGLAKIAQEGELTVVVTCRTDLIQQLQLPPGLSSAPIVELHPVTAVEAGEYLRLLGSGARYHQAVSLAMALEESPSSPVAVALDRPVWLTFARTAYWDPTGQTDGGDPLELCDGERFPDAASVRRHLISRSLSEAFREGPYESSAVGYLRFLAGEMRAPQLAWWRIRGLIPSAAPSVGALAMTAAVSLLLGQTIGARFGIAFGLVGAPVACVAILWTQARLMHRPPPEDPTDDPWARALVALICGLLHGTGALLILKSPEAIANVPWGVGLGVVFGVGVGAAIAIVGAQDGTLDAAPRRFEVSDLVAGFVAGVACSVACVIAGEYRVGLLVGATGGIGFLLTSGWTRPAAKPEQNAGPLSSFRADISGGLLFSVLGAIGFGSAIVVVADLRTALVAGATVGTAGFVVSSQAAALTITALALRVRGDAPVRVMHFLELARHHGVVRRVGTRYEFRHSELSTYLTVPQGGSSIEVPVSRLADAPGDPVPAAEG